MVLTIQIILLAIKCERVFVPTPYVKGIVSDYNNIFLLHKSEDITKNRLFPNFQLILILCLQFIHDYVNWHYSIDYCVK